MELTNEAYAVEQKRIHHTAYRRNHYCYECGLYTKGKLLYAHPIKDGLVCAKCRGKLWGIECPNKRPPMIVIDPKTDKIYESPSMCSLVDKFCLLDEGLGCDEYNDFLKEEAG